MVLRLDCKSPPYCISSLFFQTPPSHALSRRRAFSSPIDSRTPATRISKPPTASCQPKGSSVSRPALTAATTTSNSRSIETRPGSNRAAPPDHQPGDRYVPEQGRGTKNRQGGAHCDPGRRRRCGRDCEEEGKDRGQGEGREGAFEIAHVADPKCRRGAEGEQQARAQRHPLRRVLRRRQPLLEPEHHDRAEQAHRDGHQPHQADPIAEHPKADDGPPDRRQIEQQGDPNHVTGDQCVVPGHQAEREERAHGKHARAEQPTPSPAPEDQGQHDRGGAGEQGHARPMAGETLGVERPYGDPPQAPQGGRPGHGQRRHEQTFRRMGQEHAGVRMISFSGVVKRGFASSRDRRMAPALPWRHRRPRRPRPGAWCPGLRRRGSGAPAPRTSSSGGNRPGC